MKLENLPTHIARQIAEGAAAARLERTTRGADKLRTGSSTDNSPRRALPVQPHNGIIYAIVDLKADAIIGGLQLHRADAAAIRTFGDIASNPESLVAKHPEDYKLVRLGYIDTMNQITGEYITGDADDGLAQLDSDVVITGAQWKAAQSLKLNED